MSSGILVPFPFLAIKVFTLFLISIGLKSSSESNSSGKSSGNGA
jgi:hypothetical protein